ncbi:hypothetical protein KDA11_06810, partial [Candidatus Saccharibacteria bacterium]|nr:hypothetical protein [Candidatus Saccharibacteria bacterium]
IAKEQNKSVQLQQNMDREQMTKYLFNRELHLQILHGLNDFFPSKHIEFALQTPENAVIECYLFEDHRNVIYSCWDLVIDLFYTLSEPECADILREIPPKGRLALPIKPRAMSEYGMSMFLNWCRENITVMEFCYLPVHILYNGPIYGREQLFKAFLEIHHIFIPQSEYRRYVQYIEEAAFYENCGIFTPLPSTNSCMSVYFYLKEWPNTRKLSPRYHGMLKNLGLLDMAKPSSRIF